MSGLKEVKKMLNIKEEASRCLLCTDGACTRACKNGLDPARVVRSTHSKI